MDWCENEQDACCASTHCGQPMRFSWPQPWCGVREIQFTKLLSVSTNGYERQLDARGFISFRGGRSIGCRINLAVVHDRRWRVFLYSSIGDDAGARRLHLQDLNGVVHALGGVMEKADLAAGHLQKDRGGLVIVGPQAQDFDDFLLFEDLIDESMLDGNSPRIGAG